MLPYYVFKKWKKNYPLKSESQHFLCLKNWRDGHSLIYSIRSDLGLNLKDVKHDTFLFLLPFYVLVKITSSIQNSWQGLQYWWEGENLFLNKWFDLNSNSSYYIMVLEQATDNVYHPGTLQMDGNSWCQGLEQMSQGIKPEDLCFVLQPVLQSEINCFFNIRRIKGEADLRGIWT